MYFSSHTNKLDAFVVVTALLGLAFPEMKVFRALRTVRIGLYLEGTMSVVVSLARTIPKMFHVLMASVMIFFVFALIGIQLFKGRFYRCVEDIALAKDVCIAADYEWAPTIYNFDNIATAVLSLFVLAIGEGWTVIMWSAIDSTGEETPPLLNANPGYAAFFLAFMVIGNFFIMNLFASALIDEFRAQQEEADGLVMMSESQKKWLMSISVLTRTELPRGIIPPRDRWQRMVWKLVWLVSNLSFSPGSERAQPSSCPAPGRSHTYH